MTPPFLVLHRVREKFPAYSGSSNRRFFEKRISLFCVVTKHPRERHGLGVNLLNRGQHDLLEFRIVVLKDDYISNLDAETKDFWSKDNMTIRGRPAALQLFVAVIYEIIMFWEKEWIACIKALDGCITVQVSCKITLILDASIPNPSKD